MQWLAPACLQVQVWMQVASPQQPSTMAVAAQASYRQPAAMPQKALPVEPGGKTEANSLAVAVAVALSWCVVRDGGYRAVAG